MKKLCVIYNFAQLYREPIFKLIDKEWDCMWCFGRPEDGIKDMDISKLHDAKIVDTVRLLGGWKWQKGILSNLRHRDIDYFLVLGELFSLSTWALLLFRPIVAPKKKIFLWSHGWYGREGLIKKWMKRIFFGLADKTFLYGEYARQEAIKQGNNPDKLLVIHNSLDYENQTKLRDGLKPAELFQNHFGNDNPTLIFIGRLTKIKKLHLLLDAVALLKKQGESYNIVLVGDGSEKPHLEKQAMLNDIPVWFYGACYDDTKNAQLIYDADLCIAPGNVGLTAMHSMVFGTPVLTHDNFANQMPEFESIIPGKTGCFFEENSVESLAKAISGWFKNTVTDRNVIRQNCFDEIASSWSPGYQINILRENIN